jgi:hypothetical protein
MLGISSNWSEIMNKFTSVLKKWWDDRSSEIKKGKQIDPVTIRGVFYLIRKQVGPKAMPKKGGFYSALDRLELISKIPRENLRIITEPKISLITRKGETPILKADLDELKTACAIVYVEKSTIIEAIESDRSLTDRGIYIVKGMGFSTREASKVIKKAQEAGVPILTLTDMDPAGFLIDQKLKDSGVKTTRLGIDLDLVKALGLKISDLTEPIPKANKNPHLKYLQKLYPKIAKEFFQIGAKGIPHRIEIDSVMSLAGKTRFIEEILKRADLAIPVKPIKKALAYKKVPKQVDGMRNTVHDLVDNMFTKTAIGAEQNLIRSNDSFNKIRLSEIENKIEETIEKKAKEVPTTQVLEETIKALQKLLEEQKAKEKK